LLLAWFFAAVAAAAVVVAGLLGFPLQPLPLQEKKDQPLLLQWGRGGTLTPQPWRPVPKQTSLLEGASLWWLKIKSILNLNFANFVKLAE
jgi:hypothetical protein